MKLMNNSPIQLIEHIAFTADMIDLISQVVIDRKGLVEFLRHLHRQPSHCC